jgi:glycosyltransferase involved in cell wall biosynthesis
MKLSVLLMTYNHAPFVEQAVRSILDQRTDFPFEVVVAEDYSTDNTAAIVSRIEAEYPDRVRVLRRGKNLGMQANFIDAYSRCRGEYVATLDGDDYWTASDKLQRQVDFLQRNPSFSFCFHNVRAKSNTPAEDGKEIGAVADGRSDRTQFELDDLVKDNFIPFGSVVARNRLIPEFATWIRDIPGIDWIFSMLNARRGPFARIDGCLGVYRKHAGGAWTAMPTARQIKTILLIYEGIRGDLPPRLRPLVDTMVLNIKLHSECFLLREKLDELMHAQYGQHYQRVLNRNQELETYARELQAKYIDLERYTKDLVSKYTQLEDYARERDRCVRDLVDKFTGLENYTRDLQDRFATLEACARSHGLTVPKARVNAPRPSGRARGIRAILSTVWSKPLARIRVK